MEIGGFFCFDTLPSPENNYIQSFTGDIRYLMSGRCAIYYALQDLLLEDQKKAAYLPAYTCETVISSFEKANYTLYYYDVDQQLIPQFDESLLDKISLISICGYYGFSTYDRDFIKRCSQLGIKVIQDITHSAFSTDGIDPHCDYIVGSLRKWIGIPSGGIAVKTRGTFSLPTLASDQTHLDMRFTAMKMKEEAIVHGDDAAVKKATAMFWDAEMMLRQMFDAHSSDQESIEIIHHYPFNEMIEQRRMNFQYLLDNLPDSSKFTPVFNKLTESTCPSHFTMYSKNREEIKEYLESHHIHATTYWPVPPMVDLTNYPKASYVYDHIFSIPCDHRYTTKDMQQICDVLSQF